MIGQVLKSTYRLYDKVGSGGFATVYLGRNLRTNQIVAVKVPREEFAEDPGSVERFRREAQLVQRLDHPNIVRVLDFGAEAGQHYLVMDYIEGKTLAQIIRERGPLPVAETLTYAAQICDALQMAHRAGVVHRDIKPQNLMVTPDGTLKVMDFGVAKLAAMTVLTHSGQSLGTPLYMAPEIASGFPADIRSDIYSLGVVLYEMLSGKVPFEGDSPWAVMRQQIEALPRPLSGLRRDLPARVEAIVAKALAKDPAARYQTPGEMSAALRGLVGASPAGAGVDIPTERQGQSHSVETRLVGRPEGVKTESGRGRLRALPWALGAAVTLLALTVVVLFSSSGFFQKGGSKESPGGAPTSTRGLVTPVDHPNEAPAIARLTPTVTSVPATAWTYTPSPEPSTPTAPPSETLLATLTLSPTPNTPRLTAANGPVNVRSGPGTQYSVVGTLQRGQSQEIAARNEEGTWWAFMLGGRLAWVSDAVVDATGSLVAVAVVTPPPTAIPTPSPALVRQYICPSLSAVTNSNLQQGYVQPPLGQVSLAGIPFDLADGQTVTTQAASLPDNPTQVVVPTDVIGPRVVYLLITGGNLYEQYKGKRVGQVRLTFADGRIHSVDLVAGSNIREWKQGDTTVKTTSSPDVTGVWSGANKFDGSTAVIDMLRVTVPAAYQSGRLAEIAVVDTTQQTIGELDPAVNLLAITVLSER